MEEERAPERPGRGGDRPCSDTAPAGCPRLPGAGPRPARPSRGSLRNPTRGLRSHRSARSGQATAGDRGPSLGAAGRQSEGWVGGFFPWTRARRLATHRTPRGATSGTGAASTACWDTSGPAFSARALLAPALQGAGGCSDLGQGSRKHRLGEDWGAREWEPKLFWEMRGRREAVSV